MNFGIEITDQRTHVENKVRLNLIKIFAHLSASRRSIITESNQRTLFQRVSLFGLSVSTEIMIVQDRNYLIEMLNFGQKYLHLNSDFKKSQPPVFVEIMWRVAFRLSLTVFSKSAGSLDDPMINNAWKFIHLMRKKDLDQVISIIRPKKKLHKNGNSKNMGGRGNYIMQKMNTSGNYTFDFVIKFFWNKKMLTLDNKKIR